MENDYLFCLEDNCNDRLKCQKCYEEDHKHLNHNFRLIHEFMTNRNKDEMERLFGETYDKMNKPFNEIFDQLFNKWLDETEEDLRTPIEEMIGNFRMKAMKWKE